MLKTSTIKILELVQETPQAITLQCEKPEVLNYTAGQYAFLSLEPHEKTLRKPLSFSSAPSEQNISFTKRLSQSEFSVGLTKLKPGDTVTIEGPLGTFILPEKPAQIVFIAGGIGITPFRSMLLANAMESTHTITLLYGNTAEAEIIFKKELEQFNPQYQIGGTITADFIKKKVPEYSSKLFYICGSPAMVRAMCNILQNELCIPNTQIKVEKLAGY